MQNTIPLFGKNVPRWGVALGIYGTFYGIYLLSTKQKRVDAKKDPVERAVESSNKSDDPNLAAFIQKFVADKEKEAQSAANAHH